MSFPGFIIGGGPSLRGFDFESLLGLRCMAINVAFKDVPWADVAYLGDARLIDRLAYDADWSRFNGMRYTRSQEFELAGPLYFNVLQRAETWQRDLRGVVSLGNSGLSGLNLAEQLGWSPIFLLGFDCGGYTESGRMANYHKRYPRRWLKNGELLTKKFTDGFREVFADITAEVYNCNPASELDCFPKLTFDEALEAYATAEGQGVQVDVCRRVE